VDSIGVRGREGAAMSGGGRRDHGWTRRLAKATAVLAAFGLLGVLDVTLRDMPKLPGGGRS
jgi:hypothetical protein